jgi:capsular exopolysaccharide synthesis family protein
MSNLHKLPNASYRLQSDQPRVQLPNNPTAAFEGEKEEQSSLLLLIFLDILKRRLWLVILIAIVGGGLAYMRSKRKPKRYRTSTTVEVVASSPKVFTNIRDVVDHRAQSMRFYATQLVILKSKNIAQKALLLVPWVLDEPGFYGLREVKLGAVQDQKEKEELKKKMAAKRPDAAEILRRKTQIAPIRRSSLFNIAIRGTSPLRARALAQAIADAYREHNRQFHLRVTLKAFKEIKQRLTDYRGRYRKLQDKVSLFRRTNNILSTSLDDRRNLAFKQLEELNKRLILVMLKRIEQETRLRPFRRRKKISPMDEHFQPLLKSQLLRTLKAQYSSLELRRVSLLSRYRRRHPSVVSLSRKLRALRQVMTRQVNLVYKSYKTRLRATRLEERRLRAKVASVKKSLQKLDRVNLSFSQLQRRLKAMTTSLEVLNKRYFELQLLKDSTATNVRVIEPARLPKAPYAPRSSKDAVIGFILTLALAFGFFLLFELLDRSVRSLEEMEPRAGVVPLGEVPLLKGAKKKTELELLYNPDKPLSQIEEAVRSIRTNILFRAVNPETPGRQCFVFTSPSPREGKTFLATNTAISFGHMGNKTLLIDTDMRRPRVHKILSLDFDRSRGISSVLVGQHSLDEAMLETIYPNLWVLPCGPIPPSPTELLQTQSFVNFLEEARGRFDTVILDSPPILHVADAAVLSAYVDGIVLVSACASTNWSSLKTAVRRLESVGGNLLGCILNKFSQKAYRSYYGNSTYGYSAYYSYKSYSYREERK